MEGNRNKQHNLLIVRYSHSYKISDLVRNGASTEALADFVDNQRPLVTWRELLQRPGTRRPSMSGIKPSEYEGYAQP
jgi:hypothetical protein